MKNGDIIWFLDSGRKRQAVIKRLSHTDAIIKFTDRNGAIRISVNRIFETEGEIDQYIKDQERKISSNIPNIAGYRKRNQYDYM